MSRDIGVTEELWGLTDEISIGLYSPERCIIDAFRLRHLEGPEAAVEALPRRGSQSASLLALARAIPKAESALRAALEILL